MPIITSQVSNYDDTIDSCDIIEALQDWADDDEPRDDDDAMEALSKFAQEAEQYAEDWTHGVTLIRESYFTEYARELVIETDDMLSDLPAYIADNIDWDGVSEDLKVDYTIVEFAGVTYYVR